MNVVNVNPWQEAIDKQEAAAHIIDFLINKDVVDNSQLNSGWQIDKVLVRSAAPYTWSKETMQAVLWASESIPLDTDMKWNLNTETVWWYFEEPLPFKTIFAENVGIRALCFGWVRVASDMGRALGEVLDMTNTLGKIAEIDPNFSFGMPVVAWLDNQVPGNKYSIQPSQTFEWGKEKNLGAMLEATRLYHREKYGPGGRSAHFAHLSEDDYMKATEGIARFILAALAWLNKKVLVTTDGHVERHARKRYAKAVRPWNGVQVISLRKREYPKHEATEGESEATRQLSVRFGVVGHWRNQPYGVKRGERRLQWIEPFEKGPSDAPFKPPARRVYRVDR